MLESFKGIILQSPYQFPWLPDAWMVLIVVLSLCKGSPVSSPLPCAFFSQYRMKTKIWLCQERNLGENHFKQICRRAYTIGSWHCWIFYSVQIIIWEFMILSRYLLFRYRIRTQREEGRKKVEITPTVSIIFANANTNCKARFSLDFWGWDSLMSNWKINLISYLMQITICWAMWSSAFTWPGTDSTEQY